MKRWDPDGLSGMFFMLVGLAIGLPVLVMLVNGEQVAQVPAWLWVACFAGFMAAFSVCSRFGATMPRPLLGAVFAVQVGLGLLLVLAARTASWLPILLIFNAAMSVYIFSVRVTGAVIVVNTVVIGAAARLGGAEPSGVALTALVYLLLQVGSALSTLALIREARARRELAAAHAELRAAGALMEQASRADERLRISRELHDLIGHQLTVLALELEVASHKTTPPARDHVVRARRVAHDLLGDVRATVGELRRRTPELRETLSGIVDGLPAPLVHLNVADGLRADEGATAALVRCVQEIVTNTIRHSGATSLWIDVATGEDGALTLRAWDDGRAPPRIVPGNGLRGITERVEGLGGRVRFWADDGLHVTATVPSTVQASTGPSSTGPAPSSVPAP